LIGYFVTSGHGSCSTPASIKCGTRQPAGLFLAAASKALAAARNRPAG